MKEETKSNIKSEAVSCLSSAVGATIGMIIGSGVSTKVNAMEVPVPGPTPEPIPEPLPIPEPTPAPIPEPEIEVLSYETVTYTDGSQMDVAVVSVDGQEVVFIDGNMDGVADVYVMDVNGDGTLDENEFIPIVDHSLAMTVFRKEVYQNELIAQEDYINNADVDAFMA